LYFVANAEAPSEIKLTGVKDSRAYAAEWFDPRTGQRKPAAEDLVADASGLVLPERPDTLDWILVVKRQAEP
jgi:hypothetical protein